MHAAKGILTARGGMTSHAAVVARGMGRPCVSGASALSIDMKARTTLSYAMNKMAGTTQGDMRAFSLAMAAWAAFGVM